MAITEIALLHLLSTTKSDDPTFRSKLANAKSVMEKFTGRTFHYLQQIEDPTYIYIIGEWDSLDQHMNHFIPSPENQALLEDLKPYINVDWLVHINTTHADLPIPTPTGSPDQGSHIVSIGRLFMKDGQADQFDKTYGEVKHLVQDFVTEGTIGGGWRVDTEEGGKQEYFMWCPWKTVDQHWSMDGTEEHDRYFVIKEFVETAVIKHAKLFSV